MSGPGGSISEYDWQQMQMKDFCRECKTDNMIEEYSSGDVVCGDCGLISGGGIVDTRSEWRTFSGDGETDGADPNRVGDGGNRHLIGAQLSTNIAADKGGVELSRTQKKASKFTEDDKTNELLKEVFADVDAWCAGAKPGFPAAVVDVTKDIIKRIVVAGVFSKSWKKEAIGAAIILACKQNGIARTMKEIWVYMGIDRKRYGKEFNKIRACLIAEEMKAEKARKDRADILAGMREKSTPPRPTTGPIPMAPLVHMPPHARAASSAPVASPVPVPSSVPAPAPAQAPPPPPMASNEEDDNPEYETTAMKIKGLLPLYVQKAGLPFWCIQYGEQITDVIADTLVLAGRGAPSIGGVTLFLLSHLIGEPVELEVIRPICGLAEGEIL